MAYSFLSLLIIAFSAVTGLVAEGLCWFFVYRTSAYRRLESEVERASKRVAEATGSYAGGKSKKSKQEQRKEELMKASAAEIFKFQFKTAIIMGLTLLLFYNILSQFFDGIPVAKLPFDPPGFIRRASHRNLAGDDYTDCSMAFVYMLCATSVRSNLARLLGLGPSKLLKQRKLFDPTAYSFEKVTRVIGENFGVDVTDVTADTNFEDLGADSLDVVELMMAFEEEFEIELKKEAAEKIKTVADAAELIQQEIMK